MLSFLRSEGIDETIIREIEAFRKEFPAKESHKFRIPSPKYNYYGTDVWQKALTALLSGENILLVGPKATGKNVLAAMALFFFIISDDFRTYGFYPFLELLL